MKAPSGGGGLVFCGQPQTCQTNNSHHIFACLIVLFARLGRAHCHINLSTYPHTQARALSLTHTHFDTQSPACLTTKQAEETMETNTEKTRRDGDEGRGKVSMFGASWLKPARQQINRLIKI